MKSLGQFKKTPEVFLEEEKTDYSKFDVLVRAGLANKAQMQRIHTILDKMKEERPTFNNADRMIMQNIFNKMVDLLTSNKMIHQQARRSVNEEVEEQIVEGVHDTSDYKIVVDDQGKKRKVKAHRVKVEEYIQEERMPSDPPFVLVLKRQSFRMYPNGMKVALYYNERMNKFFTVPYSTERDIAANQPIQAEETQIEEAVMDTLHKIHNEKQASKVKFADGSTRTIDGFTASAIHKLHSAVNDENKKKIERMVHHSPEQFDKVAKFAFSKTK